VNSETMLTPVPGGDPLRDTEAAFLCGEVGSGRSLPEIQLLPVATIPPPGTDRRAGINGQAAMPTVRTRSTRCC
jgi:hypothetical protein